MIFTHLQFNLKDNHQIQTFSYSVQINMIKSIGPVELWIAIAFIPLATSNVTHLSTLLISCRYVISLVCLLNYELHVYLVQLQLLDIFLAFLFMQIYDFINPAVKLWIAIACGCGPFASSNLTHLSGLLIPCKSIRGCLIMNINCMWTFCNLVFAPSIQVECPLLQAAHLKHNNKSTNLPIFNTKPVVRNSVVDE